MKFYSCTFNLLDKSVVIYRFTADDLPEFQRHLTDILFSGQVESFKIESTISDFSNLIVESSFYQPPHV